MWPRGQRGYRDLEGAWLANGGEGKPGAFRSVAVQAAALSTRTGSAVLQAGGVSAVLGQPSRTATLVMDKKPPRETPRCSDPAHVAKIEPPTWGDRGGARFIGGGLC